MKTSYKFWYVTKQDDIHISEVAVRFYEGDVITLDETDMMTKETKPITRYRRSKRLQATDLPHEKNRKVKKEMSGDDCFVYTDKDFGVTDDLDDVIAYLNGVLLKDKERVAVDEQKETKKSKLKSQKIK